MLLVLVFAYGSYSLFLLKSLEAALVEAQTANSAYQYGRILRDLYQAASRCYRGDAPQNAPDEIQQRVMLAEGSDSWPLLSPEARATVESLAREIPKAGNRCDVYARWAERVFPVYIEAVNISNQLRGELKAKLRLYQKSSVFGFALLFLTTAFILYLQDRLRRWQAVRISQLENESSFKTRLLGLVAHELKTPLAAVAGFAELAAQTQDPSEQRRHLDALHLASQRLRSVLGTFLDLHRLEAGKPLVLRKRPVDLREVIEEAWRLAGGAFASGQILLHIEPKEGPMPVVADPDRLLHALLNLLENAMKYGQGKASMRVFPAGDRWRIEVETPGRQLEASIAERLFSPFARLPEHQGLEGWGLGLSLVREIATEHGGQAGAEPRSGATVFYLEIPKTKSSQ